VADETGRLGDLDEGGESGDGPRLGHLFAQAKPNVVIMLADNVVYGDIGAHGAGEVRGMPTPRIDPIAAQCLRLKQYLVEPGCTPSRAALMTGRYSLRSTTVVAWVPVLPRDPLRDRAPRRTVVSCARSRSFAGCAEPRRGLLFRADDQGPEQRRQECQQSQEQGGASEPAATH